MEIARTPWKTEKRSIDDIAVSEDEHTPKSKVAAIKGRKSIPRESA